MREKKTVFKWFTVAKYEEEQEYLRQMHQAGWKLVKVSFLGFYTFEKCEPEDVIYQLDYNQEREKGMAEYIQMFRDCGWEYICDFVGYSYFRKAASQMREDETIFSDDSSRLEMIGRVFKGRMVPLLIIFAAVICPQHHKLFFLLFYLPSLRSPEEMNAFNLKRCVFFSFCKSLLNIRPCHAELGAGAEPQQDREFDTRKGTFLLKKV